MDWLWDYFAGFAVFDLYGFPTVLGSDFGGFVVVYCLGGFLVCRHFEFVSLGCARIRALGGFMFLGWILILGFWLTWRLFLPLFGFPYFGDLGDSRFAERCLT